MYQTGVTLGFAVFGFGLAYQIFVAIINGWASMPGKMWLISVAMWAGLGISLWHAISVVNRVTANMTISLILCAVTVIIGCAIGHCLCRLGYQQVASRGSRMFKQVMSEREGGANEQRRWQRK